MSEQLSEGPWTDEVCKAWEADFNRRAEEAESLGKYVLANMDSVPAAVKVYWDRQAEKEAEIIAKMLKNGPVPVLDVLIATGAAKVVEVVDSSD